MGAEDASAPAPGVLATNAYTTTINFGTLVLRAPRRISPPISPRWFKSVFGSLAQPTATLPPPGTFPSFLRFGWHNKNALTF